MTDPQFPQPDGDAEDAYCDGDEEVDWSRVEELAEIYEAVPDGDKESAIGLYDKLAGH